MAWLILGLLIWSGAHLFKRLAPQPRTALDERIGPAAKGIVAAALALSVVLMVVGYRSASTAFVWAPPEWTVHVNNLLNLVAVGLFATGHSKSRLRRHMRHPQLVGFSLWCVAHLLVNGDLRALVLWGWLLIWAMAEIAVINAREPVPARYEGGSLAGDIRLIVITLVVFAVVTAIHAWLGAWPFPS